MRVARLWGMPGTRDVYDRNASCYDAFEWGAESLFFRRWRKAFIGSTRGELQLDAGVGTAKNAPYYPRPSQVIGVDFSRRMLWRARRRYRKLPAGNALAQGDVECLPFRDGLFDACMASFVFCSVPDPVAGLRELLRVTRPGGHLYLMEHVRPDNVLAGPIFDMLNPVAVRLSGANINRRTTDNVRRAGWSIERERRLIGGVFREIVAYRN